MKSVLFALLPIAVLAGSSANYTEAFEHVVPGKTCNWAGTCSDNLPGPVMGLYWRNLGVYTPKYFGVAPYDGVILADIIDTSQPVSISAGPCTQSFKLWAFALACPYNCTATLSGWNNGFVGEEHFDYVAHPQDSGTLPNGPVWREQLFNLTESLYRKDLRNLNLTVTNTSTYDANPGYPGFYPAIDHVVYELTNKTVLNSTQCGCWGSDCAAS